MRTNNKKRSAGIYKDTYQYTHTYDAEKIRSTLLLGTSTKLGVGFRSGFNTPIHADSIISLKEHRTIEKYDEHTYIVDAGVTYDQFALHLAAENKWFPVWPLSHSFASMGGALCTNMTSSYGARYGFFDAYVEAVNFWDGKGVYHDWIHHPKRASNSLLSQQLLDIKNASQHLIKDARISELRNVLGYNIFAFGETSTQKMVGKLMAGSLGTLGLVDKLKVRVLDNKHEKVTYSLHCPTREDAAIASEKIVDTHPLTLDILSGRMCQDIPFLSSFDEGGYILLLEYLQGDTGYEQTLKKCGAVRCTDEEADIFWKEKLQAVSDSIHNRRLGRHFFAPFGGITTPIDTFFEVFGEIEHIIEQLGMGGYVYGHPSYGDIHVKLELSSPIQEHMKTIYEFYTFLYHHVLASDGVYLTGDPGIYMSRLEYLDYFWGHRMRQLFGQVKTAFDPYGTFSDAAMFSQDISELCD